VSWWFKLPSMQSRCCFHLPSQEEDEPSDLTAILTVFSMNSSYVTVQNPLGVSFIHSIHRVVGHKVSFRGGASAGVRFGPSLAWWFPLDSCTNGLGFLDRSAADCFAFRLSPGSLGCLKIELLAAGGCGLRALCEG